MKKFQKGSNDGYALLYVLIVILVLCAIAMAICTVALRNFQSQERSVAQMQKLYQAEGEIEKFVALAEDVTSLVYSSEHAEDRLGAIIEARTVYKNRLDTLKDGCKLTLTGEETPSDTSVYRFTLTYQNESVLIETKITMSLKYNVQSRDESSTDTEGHTTTTTYYKAKIETIAHTYDSYTITHLTEEGGGAT